MADTFLAIFTGNKESPRYKAWWSMPEAEQKARMVEGMAAWHGWMERHKDILGFDGGPLGKTKKIFSAGIEDISNALSGFVIVKADSHEAAAKLFENHPQFTIFPGDGV